MGGEIPLPQPEQKLPLSAMDVSVKRVVGGWEVWAGQKVLRNTVKWAQKPQGAKGAILEAPKVPVDKAVEPIGERGGKLHADGEAGFR